MLALLFAIVAPFAGVAPVSDAALDTMRGGMRLPNGVDLVLGIDIQTRVDGQLVLQTLYASEGAGAGLSANAGGSGLYRIMQNAGTSAVSVRGAGYEVQHLVGDATGFVVANTANDRIIDTVSAINVDVAGLPSGLLGGSLVAQRVALESALAR